MNELQDVVNEFGPAYLERHQLPLHQLKVLTAIENCRTANLGGHMDECDECGHIHISYNSCRNRHCPKCQKLASERWIEQRKELLLPVQYFHTVFTLPGLLKPLTRYNQKTIYGLLFRAASQTLLELARDPKYLGAEIGFTAVLHTWGQNLTDHPHLHCIVPGGGLCATGQWANANKNFFIPVKVLSRKFKGKFLAYLREAYEAEELNFAKDRNQLEQSADFNCLLNQLYELEWVVFCKESFKNANSVIEYLGRYTHRVAISNHRIKSIRNGHVSFEWKDRIHNNQTKLMTLTGPEFLRRFLLHILPGRFMKIRHYGLLSNRNHVKVKRCQVLLKCLTRLAAKAKTNTREFLLKRLGIDIEQCPCCGSGKMIRRRKFNYQARHLLQ